MRIAYLLSYNAGEEGGVFKKVVSQIRTWRLLGAEVSTHVVADALLLDVWKKHLGESSLTFHLYRGLFDRFYAWEEAVSAVEAHQPDVIYLRQNPYMPAFRRFNPKRPLVLEINTDDFVEYCILYGMARCWYNRLFRHLLLRRAAGLVFVSQEMAESPHFRPYSRTRATTVIGNGINMEDYPVLPPPVNEKPRLVFIGSKGFPWHGVGKILKMAAYFEDWHFDVIGIRPGSFSYVPPNVSFHGPLERQRYESILAKADVGIGTLALHRNLMNEASPLKVREYLAYGLPVILGHKDTDFPQDVPFILRIPNTEDNVENSIPAIRDFVMSWRGRRVDRKDVAHLDVRYKEAKRLTFLEEIHRSSLASRPRC
ncbi:MAG: glycosyltransferase [Candidatus Caldatribacteriaceae bacterium]